MIVEIFGTHFHLTVGAYRLRFGVAIEEREDVATRPAPPTAIDVAERIARDRRSQESAR